MRQAQRRGDDLVAGLGKQGLCCPSPDGKSQSARNFHVCERGDGAYFIVGTGATTASSASKSRSTRVDFSTGRPGRHAWCMQNGGRVNLPVGRIHWVGGFRQSESGAPTGLRSGPLEFLVLTKILRWFASDGGQGHAHQLLACLAVGACRQARRKTAVALGLLTRHHRIRLFLIETGFHASPACVSCYEKKFIP